MDSASLNELTASINASVDKTVAIPLIASPFTSGEDYFIDVSFPVPSGYSVEEISIFIH